MGQKGKIRTALAILSAIGILVVYDAYSPTFAMPDGAWGVAAVAAGYYFSNAGSSDKRHERQDDEHS
jgi:hypothetical protein